MDFGDGADALLAAAAALAALAADTDGVLAGACWISDRRLPNMASFEDPLLPPSAAPSEDRMFAAKPGILFSVSETERFMLAILSSFLSLIRLCG